MSNAMGWAALAAAVGVGAYAVSVDLNVRQQRAQMESVTEEQHAQADQMAAFKAATRGEFQNAQAAINEQLDGLTAQADQHSAKIAEALERIDRPGVIASAILKDEAQKDALADALWSNHGADWVGSKTMIQQVAQEVANRYGSLAAVEATPIDVGALARAIATSPGFAVLVASLIPANQ